MPRRKSRTCPVAVLFSPGTVLVGCRREGMSGLPRHRCKGAHVQWAHRSGHGAFDDLTGPCCLTRALVCQVLTCIWPCCTTRAFVCLGGNTSQSCRVSRALVCRVATCSWPRCGSVAWILSSQGCKRGGAGWSRHNFEAGTRLVLAGTIQFATAVQKAREVLAADYPSLLVPQAKPLSPGAPTILPRSRCGDPPPLLATYHLDRTRMPFCSS